MSGPDPYAGVGAEDDPYAGLGAPEAPQAPDTAVRQSTPQTFTTKDRKGRSVTFAVAPDASDDVIRQAAARATGSTAYLRSQIVKNAPDARPTSFLQGALEGVESPLNHASEWLEHGLNHIQIGGEGLADRINSIGPALGMAGSVEDAEKNQAAYNDRQQVQGSTAGRMAGNMLGTAVVSRLPGGAAVQGAAGGALLSDDQSAKGLATAGAEGAAGSWIGDKLIKGAAGLIAPRISPYLQRLVDEGVRVTPGQIARSAGTRLGNFVAGVEDKATSLPIVGGMIQEARRQAQGDFGRATVNRALAPIGETLPQDLNGRDAVRHAGDQLSAAYERLTPQLSAQIDPQFRQDLQQVAQDASSTLHPSRLEQFRNLTSSLGRFFNGGQIDGAGFKEIESRLGSQARSYLGAQDPDARQLGQVYQQLQGAIRDLAARHNPQVANELSAVDEGWASLTQVEKASGNTRGDITPAGYSQAVKMGSNTVRRRGYARGTARNQDLSDAASAILPSQVPDAGSAGRLGQLAITGLGVKAIGGDPTAITGLAALGTAAAGYSRPAQSAIRWTLTHDASPSARRIADLLRHGSRAVPIAAPAAVKQLGN